MKKFFLFSLFLLSACASVEAIYVRDGKQVYKASCSGGLRDISDCYALASQQCAGDFEVINTIEDTSATLSSKNIYNSSYKEGKNRRSYTSSHGFDTPVYKRYLFFYCNE